MKKLSTYVVYDGIKCLRRSTNIWELRDFCYEYNRKHGTHVIPEPYNRSKHNALDARALSKMKRGEAL